jgi:hemoglobin
MPFRIDEAERNAWLVCMRAALAETVDDDELRAQLDVALVRLADTVRNVDHEVQHRVRHGHGKSEP